MIGRNVGWQDGADAGADGGGFFGALQKLADGIGQADRLQAYAEIAAGDAAVFEERFDNIVYRGGGNSYGAEAGEA